MAGRADRPSRSAGPSQLPFPAEYTGTHSGGGAVSLVLSNDASKAERFTATGVSGLCPFSELGYYFQAGEAVIRNRTFAYSSTGGLGFSSVTGTSRTVTSVTGTFALRPPCNGAVLMWSATTTAVPPSTTRPTPPPTSSLAELGPFFQGGHDSVKLVRTGKSVMVRAAFRACRSLQGLHLSVVQRLRVNGKIAAEQKLGKKLSAGVAAPAGCRDYTASWPLARKFFGSGWIIVSLKLIDGAGHESDVPQYALRAPKP